MGAVSKTTKTLLVLLLLTGLAATLRLQQLGRESLWYDDFGVYRCLSQPNCQAFLRFVWGEDSVHTEHLPLYYLFQYGWTRLFGLSPVIARLFSVCVSLLTLPLLFGLGARLFSRRAGYVAALCFSLSPYHIFHAQALRCYALFTLLAAAALWALTQAYETRQKRWWFLTNLASALVIWTHPMGLLFLPAPALSLACARRFQAAVAYMICQAILLLGPLIWLATFYAAPEASYKHYVMPACGSVLLDWIADDAIGLNKFLLPEEAFWTTPLLQALFGILLALLFFFSLILAVLRYRRATSNEAFGTTLMAGVLTLPVLFLLLISFCWRPCLFPRYTVYASLGAYILLGAMLATSTRPLRALGIGLVLLLYAFQLSQTLPYATRTRWYEAAEAILGQAHPGDLACAGLPAGEPEMARELLRFHVSDAIPVYPLNTPAEARLLAELVQSNPLPLANKDQQPRRLFAVFQQDYRAGSIAPLETALKPAGYPFVHKSLQGMECLEIYTIELAPEQHDTAAISAEEEARVLRKLAITYAEFSLRSPKEGDAFQHAASALLEKAEALAPTDRPLYDPLATALRTRTGLKASLESLEHHFRGRARIAERNFRQAEICLAKALALTPKSIAVQCDYTGALLRNAIRLAKEGQKAQAISRFQKVAQLDAERALMVQAYLGNKPAPLCAEALEGLTRALDGLELIGAGNGAEARICFEQAAAKAPKNPFIWWVLTQLYLEEGGYHKAAEAAARCYKYAPDAPGLPLLRLRTALALGDSKAVAQGLTALEDESALQRWRRFLEAITLDCNEAEAHFQELKRRFPESSRELTRFFKRQCPRYNPTGAS